MSFFSLSCRLLAFWLILIFGISFGSVLSAEGEIERLGDWESLEKLNSPFPRGMALAWSSLSPQSFDRNRQEFAQGSAFFDEISERQSIRDKLVERANRYIESAMAYPGEIVATAFVVEGLIKFGLSPEDLYLQEKIAWLKSQRAANGNVYASSGRFLPSETAWVFRSINEFNRKIAQYKSDNSGDSAKGKFAPKSLPRTCDSLCAAASAYVQSHLAEFQSALQFLNNDFSSPTLADCRGRAINEYQLSRSRYQLLATWGQYVSIQQLFPVFPPNSPLGGLMLQGLVACGTSSVSSSPFFDSTENVFSPLSSLERSLSRVCRQDRREGYFVFGHTTVLLI